MKPTELHVMMDHYNRPVLLYETEHSQQWVCERLKGLGQLEERIAAAAAQNFTHEVFRYDEIPVPGFRLISDAELKQVDEQYRDARKYG